jgi:hypothetical protein
MLQEGMMFAIFLLFAFTSNAAPSMQLGFYSSQADEISKSVKEQEKNLFRFEIPYFAEVRAKHYQDLIDNPNLSSAGKDDLKSCQEKNSPSCWIHFARERGTAFLTERGDAIWTNCHLVATWIQYQKQQLLFTGVEEKDLWLRLRDSSIPFLLRDSQGKIRKNPEDRSVFIAGVFKGMDHPKEIYCSPFDDAVKIQLHANLGVGSKKSVSPPQEGERLYLGGFPRPTDTRAAGKSSDGENFYWSFGEYLNRKSLSSYLGKDIELEFAFSNPHYEAFLGDSSQGMSGGPVFNERGEVLGIYKGFLPADLEKKDIPLASQFISNAGLRFIEIYSESLFR